MPAFVLAPARSRSDPSPARRPPRLRQLPSASRAMPRTFNPRKSEMVTLAADDRVIVLAED